jgi:hypothetical protein
MEQSPSEAESCSFGQKTSLLLWYPKFHYHEGGSATGPYPELIQPSSHTHIVFEILFNVIVQYTPKSHMINNS